jgi:hypothetical protein
MVTYEKDLDEVMESILPEELQDEVPSGFNSVGHVGESMTSPAKLSPGQQHLLYIFLPQFQFI